MRKPGGAGRLDGELSASKLGPWLRGLATNLFNPKALVFFLALLTSLIPVDMSAPGKVSVAVMLFVVGFAWFSLLSVILTRPLWQQRLQRAVPVIDGACGLVFLLVAGGILFNVVNHAARWV
ncbi:Threonine efflux protein [compost metagenome]